MDKSLNPDAEIFDPPVLHWPQLSGKHRKSKVNNESPDKEFLQATVDTLKATLAKTNLEVKKLKESNEI